MVDAFLENDSVQRPTEHTTDTHGYIDLLFPIFWLMGIDFIPRIADVGGQRLYKLDKDAHYGRLDPLLRYSVNVGRIREQWDSILRPVASLAAPVPAPSSRAPAPARCTGPTSARSRRG